MTMHAAVGNDGTRPVVRGLGRTAAAARRDAEGQDALSASELDALEMHEVTADEVRRIRAGEVEWPLPRRRSGVRVAPRGARVDYRPSQAALQGLDAMAKRNGLSRNAFLDALVLEAVKNWVA